MTTPTPITIPEIDNWLAAEGVPEWAENFKTAHLLGKTSGILWAIVNGTITPAELAARIKRAQPKQETTV